MVYSPFALCVVLVVACLLLAIGIVSMYERDRSGYVQRSRIWKPWHPQVHCGWLLAVRVVGFLYCTAILIYDVALWGPFVFEYYTQWSFTVLIVYFGVATVTSIKEMLRDGDSTERSILSNSLLDFKPLADEEFATSVAETPDEPSEEAGPDGYAAQILYQVALGAATVTDMVYWAFIFPSDSFLDVVEISMHAVNLVLLLADVALNNLVFYWFRGAYFFIYSAIFIFCTWTVHALGEKQSFRLLTLVVVGVAILRPSMILVLSPTLWPYPFLDVSVSWAPLWYLAMCIIHVLVYGLIWGILCLKEDRVVLHLSKGK